MNACLNCGHGYEDHGGKGTTDPFGVNCLCLDFREEPDPPTLCQDPHLRANWHWCVECGAIREPSHLHGDPLELLSTAELLELCRGNKLNGSRRGGK